jgi:SAM-dependent methyltransferase
MLHLQFLDPEEFLDTEDFRQVEKFLNATGRTEIGWHYIIDLTWIFSISKKWPAGASVLDAGGGSGPAQFLLAEMGFNLTNIDLAVESIPPKIANRYRCTYRELPSFKKTTYTDHLKQIRKADITTHLKNRAKKLKLARYLQRTHYEYRHNSWKKGTRFSTICPGNIEYVRGNLHSIPEIEDDTFDAVISLSALEHIPSAQLSSAIAEIKRTCKKRADWAITTSGAAQNGTWYHEPSCGFCYSVKDLQVLFDADFLDEDGGPEMLVKYQSCDYLKHHLADFYKHIDRGGMPRGIWDPKYIPVGIYGTQE